MPLVSSSFYRILTTMSLITLIVPVSIILYTNSFFIKYREVNFFSYQMRRTDKIKTSLSLPTLQNWTDNEIIEIPDKSEEKPQWLVSTHREGCNKSLHSLNEDEDSNFPPMGDAVSKLSRAEVMSQVGSSSFIMLTLLMRGLHPNGTNMHTHKLLSLVRARNVLGKVNTWRRQATATTLMVVRHPLERLNSAFRSKFANGGPLHKNLSPVFYRVYWKPILKMLKKNTSETQYITFTEFLQYVKAHPNDGHWRPLHCMCSPCAIDYDYLVRMETFSEDMKYLSRALPNPELGLDVHKNKRSNITEPQRGPGDTDHTHLRNDTLLLYRQVPPISLTMVLRKYRHDLDLFGYQVPEELMRRAALTHH